MRGRRQYRCLGKAIAWRGGHGCSRAGCSRAFDQWRNWPQRADLFTRANGPRPACRRTGNHCGKKRHNRCRAWLAGGSQCIESFGAHTRHAARSDLCAGHQGGSCDARSIQQLVYVDRRADGATAGEHGLLRKYQGAPRLQLCAVRCPRKPDRQCATHARAPGVYG